MSRTDRTQSARTFMKATLAAVIALVALVGVTTPALADEAIACTFLEISASKAKDGKGEIDAELRPLEKKLKIFQYDTFKLLKPRHDVSLSPMKAANLKLSLGSAQVLLRDIARKDGKKPRLEISLTMDDVDGKRVFDTKVSVDAGDYLVVGRSLPGGGGHLLAATCKL
jgi:hypothetical protein